MSLSGAWYLGLSAIVFTIGAIGLLVRRNVLIMFMCIELMLNTHVHDQVVAPHQQADGADGEHNGRQAEVPGSREAHADSSLWSESSGSAWTVGGRRANTTAPTTAITRRAAVASKAKR